MREATLAVENVNVQFGAGHTAVFALRQVSLEFQRGQLTLVMGPSGSGKTTLLSVLGCLLTPDGGSVHLLGESIAGCSEAEKSVLRRQHIGYVFQAFRLFRSLTALENILLALEISGQRGGRAYDAAKQALGTVGLAEKARLKPHELSGGEKQRVAIARALVNDPPILLANEPTASLDSVAGEQIARMLLDLAERENRLVVVVSHDQRWLSYAHRIVVLQDGQVVEDKKRK